MKNDIKAFSKTIIFVNLIILIVVSIVLLILGEYDWLLGYLLGSITSYITFLMHASSASTKTKTKQIAFAAGIRILISAASLCIAFFVSFIDLIATFVGLLVIKATILIVSFITNLKYRKGGNKVEDESN